MQERCIEASRTKNAGKAREIISNTIKEFAKRLYVFFWVSLQVSSAHNSKEYWCLRRPNVRAARLPYISVGFNLKIIRRTFSHNDRKVLFNMCTVVFLATEET